MQKSRKQILSFALVLILVISLAVPAFAAGGTATPMTDTATVTRSNTGSSYGNIWITIAYGNKNFTIKRGDISVKPGKTGARIVGFRKSTSTDFQEEDWNETGTWETTRNENNYSYTINLKINHTGTMTISYVLNGQTYNRKVKVVAYSNPIKSITLTGVNNGKNFASLTKQHFYTTQNLTPPDTTVKNAKLKITAAEGWKIRTAELVNVDTWDFHNGGNMRNGVRTLTHYVGAIKPSQHYELHVTAFNSYGNTTVIHYRINQNQS